MLGALILDIHSILTNDTPNAMQVLEKESVQNRHAAAA